MPNIVDRIIQFNTRRNPELLAIKYRKMRDDVFAFFRGTCHLFYEEARLKSLLDDAPMVWICGDLHLQNYGFYEGDDGLIYLDINDFDESLLAPVVWDVVRFLTSVHLSSPSRNASTQWPQLFLDAYSSTIAQGQMRSVHTATAPPLVRRVMEQRQQRDQTKLLKEYTDSEKSKRRFHAKRDKMLTIDDAARNKAIAIVKTGSAGQPKKESYKVLDVATRLSGLGSMGVERYLMLVEGSISNQLLELKQRLEPSAVLYADQQPPWANSAERVVTLQRRLQAVPPAPLIAIDYEGTAYTLRQLYPADTKILAETFTQPKSWRSLIETMGKIAAYAHLRGCGRQKASGIDDLISFVGGSEWRGKVVKYSRDCAKQASEDYDVFCKSKLGRDA